MVPTQTDLVLRNSLLEQLHELGGTAVAEVLRPTLETELNLSFDNEEDSNRWKTIVSWALIDMRDEGLLLSPFGLHSSPERRAWTRKHFPACDPTQQVWSLTEPGRSYLRAIGVTHSKIAELFSEIEAETRTTFDVTNLEDGRRRIASTIVARRGQPEFRRKLLGLYNSHCAFTNSDIPESLEAAHIKPYKGDHTDHPSNGLLLRADIHILFDLSLFAVNSSDMSIIVSKQLQDSCYSGLAGTTLNLPDSKLDWPSAAALDWHRKNAEL